MTENQHETLARLTASDDPAERLRALTLMRERIAAGQAPGQFLGLARPLVADPDQDCRWQAAIVVGECVEGDPAAVWDVVCEHGASPDEDMRDAIATVLLEHLLEHHFDAYLPRLKQRIQGGGTSLLADTLRRCWLFGQAVPHKGEIDALAASETPPPPAAPPR